MAIEEDEEGQVAVEEAPASAGPDAWAEVERELFEQPFVRRPPRKVRTRRLPAVPKLDRSRIRFAALGLAFVVLVLLAWQLFDWGGQGAPVCVRLTTSSADEPVRAAAVSADGEQVAWVAGSAIHVRSLSSAPEGERTTILPQGMLVEQLTWADGDRSFIVAARMTAGFNAGLWRVPVAGGKASLLRDDAHSPAVSPDGDRMLFVKQDILGKSIWSMATDGSAARALLADDEYDYAHPAWSPDGQRVAFVRSSRELIGVNLMTAPVAGGEAVDIAIDFDPDTGPAWIAADELLFGRRSALGASLWKLPLDEEWLPDGDPVELAHVEAVSHLGGVQVGAAGRRVSFVAVQSRVDVYVAALEAGSLAVPERVTSGRADHWPVAWSDTGDALVLNVEHERNSEIVLQPVTGGAPTPLGLGRVWAVTTGGDMLYGTTGELGTRVLRLAPDGQPQFQGELPMPAIHSRSVFRCPAQAGRPCVLGLVERDVLHLHAYDPRKAAGRGPLLAKVGLGERDHSWNISPDGIRVAVVNGGRLVKLVDLRDGAVRKLTLKPSVYTQDVAWTADGNALYVTGLIMHSAGGYVLYRVDLRGGTRELWRTDDRWFDEPVPSPDGSRIALASRTIESDAWLWGELHPEGTR